MQVIVYLLVLTLLTFGTAAQTRIDLSGQAKAVDLRQADYTRPVKTGATLPTTCGLGELFYLTSVAPGSNLHGCISDGVWGQMVAALPTQSAATAEMVLISGGENPATWGSLAGDVSGSPSVLRVQALQGRAVSSAAPAVGNALLWNGSVWQPQAINASGGSGVQVLQAGTPVGTQGVLNFGVGTGIITAASESGAQINVDWSIDPAVVVTHSSLQTGAALTCQSTHTAAAHFCDLTPALPAYHSGMRLFWIPNAAAAGGPVTLKIGGLAAIAVKQADGVTDPHPEQWQAGAGYQIWFDGTVFRLPRPAASTLSNVTRPSCAEALRGLFWHQAAGTGVKDDVSVCAKDASNNYAWRTLY